MRRVLQNLIIAFTVIFLFTGMFLYRKSENAFVSLMISLFFSGIPFG